MNLKLDSLVMGKAQTNSQTNHQVKNKVKKINQSTGHFWTKEKVLPISGFLTLLSILLISVGLYAHAYENKIYPGIKIAGEKFGGKTTAETKEILTNKVNTIEEQTIIAEIGDKKVEANINQIGVEYNPEDLTNQSYQIGHSQGWISNIKQMAQLIYKPKDFELSYNFNDENWANFNKRLSGQLEQKAENPHFEIQEGQVKIVLGQKGISIETEKLKEDILNQAKSGAVNNNITVPIITTQITIPENKTNELIALAENYTQPISFVYENGTYWAQKQDILGWLILVKDGEDFRVDISSEAIANFVGGLGNKVDKRAKNKEVTPSGQVLSEGTPGQALNRNAATSNIKNTLYGKSGRQIALQVTPVEPQVKTIYPAGTPGLFDGKYIEIVLSKQTLYAFEGETMVNSFLISSGLASHPSPQGTFSIYSKSRSVLMAGPGYYLPGVEWVNRFSGPYSIHGTYWHSNFGHPMSHGCINASNGNSAWVYDWAPIGTPVVVHY